MCSGGVWLHICEPHINLRVNSSPPSALMIHVMHRCRNLALLETYTTKENLELPSFLGAAREVTSNPHYSMYYLSAKTTTGARSTSDGASQQ